MLLSTGYVVSVQTGFSKLVRDARVERGLSQRRLAELLTEEGISIDASGINRIEGGTREPRLSEVRALTSLLDLDRDAVLARSSDAETAGYRAAAREHFLEARRATADFVRFFNAVGKAVQADCHPDPNPAAAQLRRELEQVARTEDPTLTIPETQAEYYEALLMLVVSNIVDAQRWDVKDDPAP